MKFKINCNVLTLMPSQWNDYEEVKNDLRSFGFKINDETNEIESPEEKINLTFKDLKHIDKNYSVLWNFDEAEIEFRINYPMTKDHWVCETLSHN